MKTKIILLFILSLFLISCSNKTNDLLMNESNVVIIENQTLDLNSVNVTKEVKVDNLTLNITEKNRTNVTINVSLDNISNDVLKNKSNVTENKVKNKTFNVGDTWYWQLDGKLDLSKDVYVYDVDLSKVTTEEMNILHKRGVSVICYFSAGTAEDFRDDYFQFPNSVLGNTLEDWNDEKWLDVSNYKFFSNLMIERLDLAKRKGCDGVELDNIDGYKNNNGFAFEYEDQLEYNIWIAKEAKIRGLLVGLKNNVEQVKDLIEFYDFAINEQCFEYEECDLLKPFIEAEKPVFGVEYELSSETFCSVANSYNFSFAKANYELNGYFKPCN